MSSASHRVLFVVYDTFKTQRLGIQILSSIALEEGYERDLLIINSMTMEEGVKKAQEYHPTIVAYSAITYEHTQVLEFNQLLKRSGLHYIAIFGGHHFTFNPEIIFENEYIDIICRGEGEVAFRNFLRAVRHGRDYQHIENLWVRQGNTIIQNPVGTLIRDLDSIPFPDRNLLPVHDRRTDHLHGNSTTVIFSRGCPQKCAYCFHAKYNILFKESRIFRYRSAENVIQELQQIIQTCDIDIIIFVDDCFSYLPKRVIEEFCQKYKQEIGKPFVAAFRADSITEEMVVTLKEAGLYLATIGVECGDEYVAHHILQRGKITNEDIIIAFQLFHKQGVKTWSFNLMALPVPNPLQVDLETIRLNTKLSPLYAQFNILVPIPYTPIWDYCVEHGYLDEKFFLKINQFPSELIKTTLQFQNPGLVCRVSNLHKFADIVVKYPFLLPLVKILIRFPPNRIYQYIFLLWYGYWKSIGSYDAKFSVKLVMNGIKAIRKYLEKY